MLKRNLLSLIGRLAQTAGPDVETIRKIIVENGKGYLFGELSIGALQQAAWIRRNDISVIGLPAFPFHAGNGEEDEVLRSLELAGA